MTSAEADNLIATLLIQDSALSDPPELTAIDVARIDGESRRLGDAFRARTRSMEILTSADLRTRIRSRELPGGVRR